MNFKIKRKWVWASAGILAIGIIACLVMVISAQYKTYHGGISPADMKKTELALQESEARVRNAEELAKDSAKKAADNALCEDENKGLRSENDRLRKQVGDLQTQNASKDATIQQYREANDTLTRTILKLLGVSESEGK